MSTPDTATRTYTIDKAHSEISFQVRHLVTKVRGRFTDFEGTIRFDETHPERSSVTFSIQTASVTTNAEDRDAHLRSADFFHVDEHPTLTFTSTQVSRTAPHKYLVVGDLSIRGVRKEVQLPADFLGHAKDPWGAARIGFEGELLVDRKDFGLVWNAALETGGFLVGDEVKIHLSIQAVAQ